MHTQCIGSGLSEQCESGSHLSVHIILVGGAVGMRVGANVGPVVGALVGVTVGPVVCMCERINSYVSVDGSV